jgi:hypothetical protein
MDGILASIEYQNGHLAVFASNCPLQVTPRHHCYTATLAQSTRHHRDKMQIATHVHENRTLPAEHG